MIVIAAENAWKYSQPTVPSAIHLSIRPDKHTHTRTPSTHTYIYIYTHTHTHTHTEIASHLFRSITSLSTPQHKVDMDASSISPPLHLAHRGRHNRWILDALLVRTYRKRMIEWTCFIRYLIGYKMMGHGSIEGGACRILSTDWRQRGLGWFAEVWCVWEGEGYFHFHRGLGCRRSTNTYYVNTKM